MVDSSTTVDSELCGFANAKCSYYIIFYKSQSITKNTNTHVIYMYVTFGWEGRMNNNTQASRTGSKDMQDLCVQGPSLVGVSVQTWCGYAQIPRDVVMYVTSLEVCSAPIASSIYETGDVSGILFIFH